MSTVTELSKSTMSTVTELSKSTMSTVTELSKSTMSTNMTHMTHYDAGDFMNQSYILVWIVCFHPSRSSAFTL